MDCLHEIGAALKISAQVAGQGRFWAALGRALLHPPLLLVSAVLAALYLKLDFATLIAGGFAPSNIALALGVFICALLITPLLMRAWCPVAARAVVETTRLDLPELPLPSAGRWIGAWLVTGILGLLLLVPAFFIPRPFSWLMLLPAALLFSGYQLRCALSVHADGRELQSVVAGTMWRRALLWFPLCGLPLYLYAEGEAALTGLFISPYEFTATTTSKLLTVLGTVVGLAVFAGVLVLWAALSLQALSARYALTGRRPRPAPVSVAKASSAPVSTKSHPVGKWLLAALGVLLGMAGIVYLALVPLTHRYLASTDTDYRRDLNTGDALALALKNAGCDGNLERIKQLMRVGIADSPESLGPALVCAAKTGQMEAAFFLISQHASVNAMPVDPEADPRLPSTALQYAVFRLNGPLVDLLLSKGADVALQAPGSPGALHFAAANMDVEMIAKLIAAGARPDAPAPQAPIHYFVATAANGLTDKSVAGWTATLARAERAGLSVNGLGEGGGNLLHWAADHGELGLIEALLARGLDRHHKDKLGAMPFMQLANWYRNTAQQPGPELEFMMKALTSGVPDINAPAGVETTLTASSSSVESGWTLARAAAAKPRLRAVFGERISYTMLGGAVREQQWPLDDREQALALLNELSAAQVAAAPSLAIALRQRGWDDLALQAESKR